MPDETVMPEEHASLSEIAPLVDLALEELRQQREALQSEINQIGRAHV